MRETSVLIARLESIDAAGFRMSGTDQGGVVNWQRARTITAWVLLGGSLIGWPISMVTFAKDEPRAVLSLSWMAIVIEAGSLLTASQVREKQEDGDGRD